MSLRDEKKIYVEKKIYDAAIALFIEQGYLKTTLIDIALESDVSTRTLYKYFPTKESILYKFTRSNVEGLKTFISTLPKEMTLEEKVLATMVKDYKTMFRTFDISYLMHPARNEAGMICRFDVENLFILESIYYSLFKDYQLSKGVHPNESAKIAASIIVALYRHLTDLFRFREAFQFEESRLKSYLSSRLDVIWDGIQESLLTGEALDSR
ncbi:MAG: TetR/AcrR family transcriptional regulator [Actinobacteria bacterium]|nr:TetR/AcrR family transcriptional regulator [Actinomycetota bacterium]